MYLSEDDLLGCRVRQGRSTIDDFIDGQGAVGSRRCTGKGSIGHGTGERERVCESVMCSVVCQPLEWVLIICRYLSTVYGGTVVFFCLFAGLTYEQGCGSITSCFILWQIEACLQIPDSTLSVVGQSHKIRKYEGMVQINYHRFV